jgi:hypothetical protein
MVGAGKTGAVEVAMIGLDGVHGKVCPRSATFKDLAMKRVLLRTRHLFKDHLLYSFSKIGLSAHPCSPSN